MTIQPLSKRLLADAIYRASHITGSFTLRSGKQASDYFDKYRFEADPHLLFQLTKYMAELIPADTEVLAGLEMGGIPVATLLSHHSGLPAAFVRKKPKEYGTARFSEGADVTGKRVLIIEDVVTSGGQACLSIDDLRGIGAKVERALCVIDRQEGGVEALASKGIKLLALFKREDFVAAESASPGK